MSTTNRKPRVLAALIAVFLLALAVGCRGFFVNPVLTTITVGPNNQNLQQNSTLQMSARGTYDDGSVKTLTSNVSWSSSSPDVASITSGGLAKGLTSGTTTISASAETITGQATLNVVLIGVTSISITPTGQTVIKGGSQPYTCMATVSGQPAPVNVTATVTWTLPDVTDSSITITNGQDPATLTVTSSAASGSHTIQATYPGLSTPASTTFTVP